MLSRRASRVTSLTDSIDVAPTRALARSPMQRSRRRSMTSAVVSVATTSKPATSSLSSWMGLYE